MLALVFLSLFASSHAVSCLDSSGSPVDWFFMYKMPSVVGKFKGYTYLYTDSNNGAFQIGDIKDASNPLSLTAQQMGLYGASVDTNSVAYLLWNDQTYQNLSGTVVDHEQDSQGNYYAHSKASIAFDSSSGFWLTHSAPGFPYDHSISPSSWSFPYHQAYYAQHFFCVSFNPSKYADTISQFLLNYHIYVYDYNVPTKFQNSMPNFVSLCNSQFNLGRAGQLSFASSASTPFVGFGKNGATNSDLYEDYVAPGLNTGLVVESWCGGTFGDDCQLSPCQGAPIVDPSGPQRGQSTYKYDSIIIEKFSFASDLYFTTEHNHAKFALSYPSGTTFCAGDINMVLTQRKRGGGAICFQNSNLYGLIQTAIVTLNTTCGN